MQNNLYYLNISITLSYNFIFYDFKNKYNHNFFYLHQLSRIDGKYLQ